MKPSLSFSTLVAFTVITGALFSGCAESDTQTQITPMPPQDSTMVSTPTPENPPPAVTPPTTDTNSSSTQTSQTSDSQTSGDSVSADTYKDNTYTEAASYVSPAGNEDVVFTFVLKNDVIADVDLKSDTTHQMSQRFQGLFLTGIKKEIIGKKVDEIGSFDRVNGSSLTDKAFNDAFKQLKEDAKA